VYIQYGIRREFYENLVNPDLNLQATLYRLQLKYHGISHCTTGTDTYRGIM